MATKTVLKSSILFFGTLKCIEYISPDFISSEKENVFQLYDENSKSLKIRELHNFSDDTKTQKYSFSFIPNGKVGFTRLGIFQIDENKIPNFFCKKLIFMVA